MSATLVGSARTWKGSRDAEGHRTYNVEWLVRCSSTQDGPFVVMNCPGLPVPGTWWVLGNDSDLWAWCMPDMEIDPLGQREGERFYYWSVKQRFTTKPPAATEQQRPFDTDGGGASYNPVENPLLEPPKVSGGSIQATEEATHDRFGRPIVTSSHEQIRGPQNEWPADGGDSISISQNVADLELGLLDSLKNCVNDTALWGRPARYIRFASYTWEKKYYGYLYYYTRNLEFVTSRKGFDRDVLDEGTKVLKGHWDINGRGATLNITTSGGAVTSATVNQGGTGYTKSATVNIMVTGGGGHSAIVAVTTNASGVVTGISSVVQGGSGYSNTTGAATQAENLGWVLDPINGRDPSPANPAHFIRYQDPQGNLSRVVLDGAGKPFDAGLATSFVDDGTIIEEAIQDPPGTSTAGVAAPTGLAAALLNGGELFYNSTYDYCVTAVTSRGETVASNTVVQATGATFDAGRKIRLTWNASPRAASYNVYRKLNASAWRLLAPVRVGAAAGRRRIEKFPSANLLLLGIPTTI